MNIKYCFIFLLLLLGCQNNYEEPIISLENYVLEEGFKLEVIASEPLLIAPVAIDFDHKGRIWTVEMPAFMQDVAGKTENEPNGVIKILEDLDGDGIMDHSKIFLDSLVLPRAIALVYGGVLYAEPPNLWFVEISNDKPGKRILVDSLYAVVGNTEHQPNGLKLNIDNWIYNAKSHFRYQRKNNVWLKEPTAFRGQWGISHDNFGRLYYNDNSRQLLGDYVLPNRLIGNKYFKPEAGVGELLTNNQKVYPLHDASVNRGYMDGVLNADSLLVNVTASCGPVVYRGGAFPNDYDQNVFVCVPEANLIKRNKISYEDDKISARQAWTDKEFLASTDEAFRPVNLSNGPDGSLYITDMHRGIIEHHAYLTPYLRDKILNKQLDTIVNFGRILKVSYNNSEESSIPHLNDLSTAQLVDLLKSKNGWIRDRVQHYLIFNNKIDAIESLLDLAQDTDSKWAQIHALYTLDGLDALGFETLIESALNSQNEVVCHAIVLMDKYISNKNSARVNKLYRTLIDRNDASLDLYLCTSVSLWYQANPDLFGSLVNELALKYEDQKLFGTALLAGMSSTEEALLNEIGSLSKSKKGILDSLIQMTFESKQNDIINSIYTDDGVVEDNRTTGAKLYSTICATCHGQTGNGITGLAPPLLKSEYVKNVTNLGLIILHGLKGPVQVNGQLYEDHQAMPGLLNNTDLSDEDIAGIIAYVSNAFSDNPKQLSKEEVGVLRSKKPANGPEYTASKLDRLAHDSQ